MKWAECWHRGDAANTPNRRIFLDLFGGLENCGGAGHIPALEYGALSRKYCRAILACDAYYPCQPDQLAIGVR